MSWVMIFCLSCNYIKTDSVNAHVVDADRLNKAENDSNPYPNIGKVPLPPGGFARIKRNDDSFGSFLSNIKLKKDKTVYNYNGTVKANQTAQFAVLDISVGRRDLQQCADAIMRLRADYLYSVKRYGEIHFADNSGRLYQFREPYTPEHLQQYLQMVFGNCGTASLSKQLRSISFKDVEPGDVIIRGGFPGHAVIVMDVATNKEGMKIYLLAQSYMPAQDIHVLVNPTNKFLSPWYLVNNEALIETPEYNFTSRELKRW